MFSGTNTLYFIDLNIMHQIFIKNWWYISKLLLMSTVVFYWIPTKIFPQKYTGKGIEKVIFNIVYMIAYIEIIIVFLIAIKAFSLILFIFILIATKLAFVYWYDKKNIIKYLDNLRIKSMIYILDLLDKPTKIRQNTIRYIKIKTVNLQSSITMYNILKYFLFITVFVFVISILMAKGLNTYADSMPDTSQFLEWVGSLQKNILYADNKTFGADFYGISVMIFFVNLFTNIDQIILFPIYPILLVLFLYLSIYYIVKDFTNSKYIAIFAVMIHGLVLMSPFINSILGKVVVTSSPEIVKWFGLSFYIPTTSQLSIDGFFNGSIPYIRYISGMAYEHSSIFVLLNFYFLIKTLQTHSNKYLIVYALTLMLVFTFHGGGAIILMVISILITINAALFKKIDKKILKKGGLTILISSVFGNLWVLSMIKYGIPQDFGAAAPILDKIFKTNNNQEVVAKIGFETIRISQILPIDIILSIMIVIAFILAFFTKNKFVNTSYILSVAGIFFIYFIPNLGLPILAKQSRLAEYMFFAITLLLSFYYYYIFYKPIYFIFKKYTKVIMLFMGYAIFLILSFGAPKWLDSKFFWKSINGVEYSSIPYLIMKIYNNNKPFSWTVVSYVQEYAKVLNKGYHINTQNFLLKYNPKSKYLKIPTKKIYIFIENMPNPYKGLEEWFYRWRYQIQNSLKSWIIIYASCHDNIHIYQDTGTVTVYEIDNSSYINYLREKAKNEQHIRTK